MEEWEQIYNTEKGLSIDERKSQQFQRLKETLNAMHSLFGPAIVSAIKAARKDPLTEKEKTELNELDVNQELVNRIEGLISEFSVLFYKAFSEIYGEEIFQTTTVAPPTQVSTHQQQEPPETVEETAAKVAKLPKGFNKWDLKMIKLHESHPAEGKRIWIEYWTLKGKSDIGEVLYNPTKDLFYFKPYKIESSSFALSDEHGRKATAQARNYYFRVCPNPPEE